MGIFKRIFKVAQASAHAGVEALEDPIKMTEQGIRDLKQNLQGAMSSLAQVKALTIRLQSEADGHRNRAADYERKAMMLVRRADVDGVSDDERTRLEGLAASALESKVDAVQQAERAGSDHDAQRRTADQLQAKVDDLKRQISRYENEAVTLRARSRAASSMRKINRQLASGADASGTVAMLEKMKHKVQEEESLAEAYDALVDVGGTIDDDINRALAAPSSSAGADALAELRAKMGTAKTDAEPVRSNSPKAARQGKPKPPPAAAAAVPA